MSTQEGSLGQLREQTGAAADQRESQMQVVTQLQEALSNGDIDQAQYDEAVGSLFDQRLALLQGDLVEQGRVGAAASVPVGIGVTEGAEQQAVEQQAQQAAGEFGAPPQGVVFGPGSRTAPKLDEDQGLLFGETMFPNEGITAGSGFATRPSPEMIENLPLLVQAAQDPNAPPALRALLDLLDYHLNLERQTNA